MNQQKMDMCKHENKAELSTKKFRKHHIYKNKQDRYKIIVLK